VFLNRDSDDVMYRIRAVSRPRAVLARLGHPFVRSLQARFRRESAEAMKRATLKADDVLRRQIAVSTDVSVSPLGAKQ